MSLGSKAAAPARVFDGTASRVTADGATRARHAALRAAEAGTSLEDAIVAFMRATREPSDMLSALAELNRACDTRPDDAVARRARDLTAAAMATPIYRTAGGRGALR
jgi:hypothetical protein